HSAQPHEQVADLVERRKLITRTNADSVARPEENHHDTNSHHQPAPTQTQSELCPASLACGLVLRGTRTLIVPLRRCRQVTRMGRLIAAMFTAAAVPAVAKTAPWTGRPGVLHRELPPLGLPRATCRRTIHSAIGEPNRLKEAKSGATGMRTVR